MKMIFDHQRYMGAMGEEWREVTWGVGEAEDLGLQLWTMLFKLKQGSA